MPSLGKRKTDILKKETITLPVEGKFGFSRESTVIYIEVFTCLYQLGEYCTFIFLAHFKHYYCFILLLLQLKTAESIYIVTTWASRTDLFEAQLIIIPVYELSCKPCFKPESWKRGTKYKPAVSGREKVPVTIRTAPFKWNNYIKKRHTFNCCILRILLVP